MDEKVRQFRTLRERASTAAQDFLSANPGCAGVVIVSTGFSVHRDRAGKEQVCFAQKQENSHG